MKKLFTLIELVIVIVVLGILAAIVIPNVSNYKEDSTQTVVASNELNLQTAVDMYGLKNDGELPSVEQPTIGSPSELGLNLLYPKYMRGTPKDGANYSIDYKGEVYASTASFPTDIKQEGGLVTWEDSNNADSYNIYNL